MSEALFQNVQWPPEPYPGLRPFQVTSTSDETLIFFGRNKHKDEILERLDKQQLVFVTGPSGCGKSSLVKVGVLPTLRAGFLARAGSDWRIVTMRPGLSPILNLSEAFSKLSPSSSEEIRSVLLRDVSGLWMAADIQSEGADHITPTLLIVDQFEEVFGSQNSVDDTNHFIRLLVRFFERPHPHLYVILTMRTDFLDACTKFAGLASAINATQFLTPILGLQELVQAIRRPAEDYGGEVEKPLLDRLLIDMRPGATYDPDNLALLQHALQWLWRRACARNGLTEFPRPTWEHRPSLRLDLQSYIDAGGLRGILNLHADEVANRYEGERNLIFEALFKRLAEKTPGGGYRRSPARMMDLCALTKEPSIARQIVSELNDPQVGFLDLRDERDDAVVDICHEALIRSWNTYRRWVDDESEKVRLVRRLANDAVRWQQNGRRDEDLQHGQVLHFLSRRWNELTPTTAWAQRYFTSPGRPERLSSVIPLIGLYFDASNAVDAQQEEKLEQLRVNEATARIRLARDRLIGVAILLAGIAGLFGWRYWVGDREAKAQVAGSLRVLAEDSLTSRGDAATALLWTLNGLEQAPSYGSIFEPLLYRTLQDLRLTKISRYASPPTSVSFSPDSKFFVSAHQDGKIRVSSVELGILEEYQIPMAPSIGGGLARARWSPDGQLIAISGRNAVTVLWACSLKSLKTSYGLCKTSSSGSPKDGKSSFSLPFAGQLTNALFSPDSKMLLVTFGQTFFQGDTVLYDISSLANLTDAAMQPLTRIGGTTWAVAFTPDAKTLAIGQSDGNIHLFDGPDFSQGTILNWPASGPNQVWSLSFGSSNELYSGHSDGSIYRWDLSTRNPELFKKQGGQVFQIFVSRDGQWLAASSDNGFVTLWSLLEQKPPIKLGPHRGPVWNFDLGGDSADWILAPASDSIYLWNRRGALAPVKQLAVRPESSAAPLQVSTTMESYVVRFNDQLHKLRRPHYSMGASIAAADPTGNYIAVAEDRGTVLLYSLRYNELVAHFRGAPHKWKAVAFEDNAIVGISEEGDRISWPFFKDKLAMTGYAGKHIPVVDGHPMQLDKNLLCSFGKLSGSTDEVCQSMSVTREPRTDASKKAASKVPQP